MANSSFYANGLPYGPDETGLGNVPASTTPTPAPSSFYQSGTVYSTLQNSDVITAEIDADLAAAQAAAAAAAVSETNAANSATAAATSATNAASAVQAAAGTATPLIDGTAAVGTGTKWAREDHKHPTDTTRAPFASPALTGTPTSTTPPNADNSTKIATTAWVQTNAPGTPPATATPLVDGTAAVGVATKYAREDHVHPTDTTRAPVASPTFTGAPAAPTATAGTNTTQLATTAFVASTIRAVRLQKFTASGTYTPNANMVYCVVEAWGGGAAGGGSTGAASSTRVAGGGGSGGRSRSTLSAATVGASKAVAIGAAGAVGAAGAAGGAGGQTTFGATIVVANGGLGGTGGVAYSQPQTFTGAAAGTGDIAAPGISGSNAIGDTGASMSIGAGGAGAASAVGAGGLPGLSSGGSVNGLAATGFASGGGGGSSQNSATSSTGGAGAPGLVVITEYCTQ